MSRPFIAVILILLLASSAANAIGLGDRDKGHAYVRQFCVECHAVEKGEMAEVESEIPSFQEAADSEGMSQAALAVWLQSSHPNMPNFIIPPADVDNIIAYILSLRTPK
ncbi:MAG: c-type cytochrome [Hyphomicrobium sp.]|jgi:mono/diheme cytochrome c family protein